MINPFTTPQAVIPAAPVHELFNVAHSRPFSLLFANYSCLLGAAGAMTVIWAVYVMAGRRSGPIYRFTMPFAVAMIVSGFLNVLTEVRQPSRLLYGYFLGWQYGDTAIIKYGIILLPLYLIACWWLTFQAMEHKSLNAAIERLTPGLRPWADLGSLWSRHYSVLETTFLRRWVLGIVVFLSLFATLYSAIFLMNEHGVAVWNSPAPALLFLASAIAEAALMMLVVLPLLAWLATGTGWVRMPVPTLRWTASIAIGIEVVTWFGWLWWMGRFGTVAELRAAQLYMGPYAGALFWNWTFAGLIVPLIALVTPLGRHFWAQLVAALGAMWGSYAVRIAIVIGGEALMRSGAGYQAFAPGADMLRYTAFSVVALIGVLAALLLALPKERAPELASSTDQ